MIKKYRNKISGLLLDRIEIHVEVPYVKHKEVAGEATGETSYAADEVHMLRLVPERTD